MTAATNSPGKSEGHKVGAAVLGLDTIGTEVYRLLNEKTGNFERRIDGPVEIVGIAMSDKAKPRPNVDEDPPTDDAFSLIQRGDVDLVVEVISGINYPRRVVLKTLYTGKSIMTISKALVAAYGEELSEATDSSGVDLFSETAVAAAIPVIGPLRRSLAGDTVNAVMGIIDGTTNFILDTMDSTGADYDEMLAEATHLGYAEADPTTDVGDHDIASKAAILASLAFYTRVTTDDVHCKGITEITTDDIAAVESAGCTIKLLATYERVMDEDGKGSISARIYPALIPRRHPLATIRKSFNAVFIEAETAGRLMFYDNGAGGGPTASAVLGDLVAAARNIVRSNRAPGDSTYANLLILDFGNVRTHHHISLHVSDCVGVFVDVVRTFSDYNISLHAVHQEEGANGARLVIVTHKALEEGLEATVDELRANGAVLAASNVIHIKGMDI